MASCEASPLFVSALYNVAVDSLRETGAEEHLNNTCFSTCESSAVYGQPMSLSQLEAKHYAGQPLLWAPERASERTEASETDFLAERSSKRFRSATEDLKGARSDAPALADTVQHAV